MISISSPGDRSSSPVELLVSWKQEPVSPLAEEAQWLDSEWLSPHHFTDCDLDLGDKTPSGRELTADKLFSELDDLIKEEPYSSNNWYVEKAEVPEMFEGYLPMADWNVGQLEAKYQSPLYHEPPQTQVASHPPSSHFFLQELEDALTPPDSPKDEQLELVKSLLQEMGPVEQNGSEMPVGGLNSWVEATAESVCSVSSPEPWSSPQGGSSDSSEDPDWSPFPTTSAPSAPSHHTRPKPYSRPAHSSDEKKLRKKEQNKNAASRYRQKKKAEVEVILTEEKELADHNEKLKADVVELGREIKYLKSLMREFFKKKGLVK